jgi:hypothetical protein
MDSRTISQMRSEEMLGSEAAILSVFAEKSMFRDVRGSVPVSGISKLGSTLAVSAGNVWARLAAALRFSAQRLRLSLLIGGSKTEFPVLWLERATCCKQGA